jgi:UDP-N-acetylmuramate--alanine ligase
VLHKYKRYYHQFSLIIVFVFRLMNLSSITHIYFLGIGGIGMSALARYYNRLGYTVAGYDKTETPLTQELVAEGIVVNYNESVSFLLQHIATTEHTLVVLTPAVPKQHTELIYLQQHNFTIYKRSQVLGHISSNQPTLAIAGTHGKTTTSSLLGHIMQCHSPTIAFMGGITANYNSNLLLPQIITAQTPCVVEADEYDRSFLTLHPQIAALTSVDADHLDIYGTHDYLLQSFELFVQQVIKTIIIKHELNFKPTTQATQLTYSLNNTTANYYAQNITIVDGFYHFDIVTPSEIITDITFGMAGLHNVENAVAATAVALQLPTTNSTTIKQALSTFLGVKRRFEYIVRTPHCIYIDDYAHHPTELTAFISSVKKLYPTKRLTGVFQPHLFTRTRDFAVEFSKSLSLLDDCILLPIYPARELPIEGVSSEMLINTVTSNYKAIVQKQDLITTLTNLQPEIILSIGAGDIDALIPVIKAFATTIGNN